MRSGLLRHRVIIEERQTGRDSSGAPVDTWSLVTEIWGNSQIVTGRERWANEHTATTYTAAISIRNRTDLKTEMRVKFGARTLEIQAIIDPTGRGKELKLLCVDYGS